MLRFTLLLFELDIRNKKMILLMGFGTPKTCIKRTFFKFEGEGFDNNFEVKKETKNPPV